MPFCSKEDVLLKHPNYLQNDNKGNISREGFCHSSLLEVCVKNFCSWSDLEVTFLGQLEEQVYPASQRRPWRADLPHEAGDSWIERKGNFVGVFICTWMVFMLWGAHMCMWVHVGMCTRAYGSRKLRSHIFLSCFGLSIKPQTILFCKSSLPSTPQWSPALLPELSLQALASIYMGSGD